MLADAIKVVEQCLENQETTLDLGCLGLTDADFAEGGVLDRLIRECTHIDTFILSPEWWEWNSEEDQYEKQISANQGVHLRLTANPPTLRHLPQLRRLVLARNAISDIQNLDNLIKLQQLYLYSNQINHIQNLDNLKQLQQLDLSNNQITHIQNLDNLIQLQLLDLADNQITQIQNLQNLIQLQKLYLSSNQITHIQNLDNLTQLQKLYLSSNQITHIQNLDNLTQLQKINLENNQITHIQNLDNLTQLQQLYLYSNQITHIQNLDNLTQLQQLYLANNQITHIQNLDNLTQLQQLDLNSNQITQIQNLDNLTQLQQLDLRNNHIKFLPLLLVERINLPLDVTEESYTDRSAIMLSGNEITDPPPEVLAEGREAVLDYFRGKQLPLNECKVIFIGDGGVGKTSLMKCLAGIPFDEKEKQTHGINKLAWKGVTKPDGSPIKVNLWDFGGQHIQHSLHQFFFTERVIYVLVLNPRNDNNAYYWLEQVDKLGKDSRLLVVYNCKQEEDLSANFLQNFYQLRQKFPQLSDPIVLSCKSGSGINDFTLQLSKAILSSEGINDTYRAEWYALKNRLEQDVTIERNYIPYTDYERWCEEEHYGDSDEPRRRLLRILNRVGAIVYFDKPVLHQYNILNPEWITSGAYAILTHERTNQTKGRLSWDDLEKIFKEPKTIFSNNEITIQYRREHFEYIITLMKEYGLCQRSPLEEDIFLIPAAFGEQPNRDYTSEVAGGREYQFVFDAPFEMLIMHRFIAKNLKNVQGKDYWHSGIYFKHASSNTWALVTASQFTYQIHGTLKGDNIRGMWEVIRNDFREIFASYHNFKPSEQVKYTSGDQSAYLDYEDMLEALRNGVHTIDYDLKTRLRKINVLEVLSQFAAPENFKKMERESIKVEVNPYIEVKPEFTQQVTQTVHQQTQDGSLKAELQQIKAILDQLEQLSAMDNAWNEKMLDCLDAIDESLNTRKGPEAKAKENGLFKKMKDLRDVVSLVTFPVDVAPKIPKLIEMIDGALRHLLQ